MTGPSSSSSSPGDSASKSDYSFGQVAIRENCCTFEQVKECLDIQTKLRTLGIEPKRLGDILIEKGYLTAEQAVKISKLQAQSAGAAKVTIPGYEVLAKIGAGAMGSVYKARQVSMDRIVALKVLSPQYSRDRSFVERFLREARAVAKLNHENIISGIDVGEVSGIHYFVMEFVDGVPVSKVMRKEGLIPEKRCLEIALQVAKALSHAHKHGLIHRDVKPENIMITTSGIAKLCDLGLAKQTKGDAGATMDGMSVGTPNYISPEQARGESDIDIRTDIYSLGCSLYHMATGTTPFSGPNPMVVMTKHVTEWPDPPRKRNPNLSAAFNDLVVKLMGKRREERPQDPEALMRDLETTLRGVSVAAAGVPGRAPAPARAGAADAAPPLRARSRPPTTFHAGVLRRKSSTMGVALAAIGVVTVVVILVILVGGGSPPPAPPPPPAVRTTGSTAPPPPVADPAGRVSLEIKTLRDLVLPELESNARDDRYTFPYGKIQAKIAESERDPIAQKAWTEELQRFIKEAEAAIAKHSGWDEIRQKAKSASDAGHFAKALDEIGRLQPVYRHFREEDPAVLTKTGREHKDLTAKIQADLRESLYTGLNQAQADFRNPQTRDAAYGALDALAVSVPADRKADIETERRKFIEAEMKELAGEGPPAGEKLRAAQARIDQLKKLHVGNAPVTALLDTMSADLRKDAREARAAALARAVEAYAAFRPTFVAALKARDLAAARKALNDLCLSPANMAVQSALLPAPAPDTETLRSFLDPARSGPYADVKKIVTLAEEGAEVARKQDNLAARGLYLDVRTAALLEDLVEQALEGARVASRDPARFKAFSPPLAGAASAEPAARKPGEAALAASFAAGVKSQLLLAPKAQGAPVVVDADLVELARRAPSAAADAYFPLKAFHLFHAAGSLRPSKTWYEQLKTPVLLMGLEDLAPTFTHVLPESAEAEARALFESAWDLFHKKKDAAGGKKKFLDCAQKYAGTDYMRETVATLGRSRLEVVETYFGGAPRKALLDVFGTAGVRDLGRGRFEVVYTFKDDREMGLFVVGDGGITARRLDPGPGVRLQTNGVWYWNVPLRGDVLIEAAFQMPVEGPFGLVVCGDGGRAGYLGVLDLPLPGVPPIDAIMKLPLAGPQSMVAPSTSNLSTNRAANQALFQREGTRLRFTVNGATVEGDNSEVQQGRAGVAIGPREVVLTRLKIVGEVESTWLEAEIKRVSESR